MKAYEKREFIYECAMRGFQGSLANPTQQASIASIVRDAEKLWQELQDWEAQQSDSDAATDPTTR